jgi:hypothetical protein
MYLRVTYKSSSHLGNNMVLADMIFLMTLMLSSVDKYHSACRA